METQLANNLISLASAYGALRQIGETTVGRHCAADGRFFSRIREGKTFTAKKYDEVVDWFSENWPDKSNWPAEVPRTKLPRKRVSESA